MNDAYHVPDYPSRPIPRGGYAQSPTGVLVPLGLCGLDGCVYLAHHKCDHSWNRPFSTRVAEPTVDDDAVSATPDTRQVDTSGVEA